MTEDAGKSSVELARRLVHELAKNDPYAFMRLMHPIVAPGVPFIDALHLRAIAYYLQRVGSGEIKRLLIAVPPRHYKSFAASVAFPAWALGHSPHAKIICASYGADLAKTFARQSRDILRSPKYAEIFPGTQLDPANASIEAAHTTRKGYRLATSVNGPVTGMGAHFIIVDDPMKAAEAQSESERSKVYDWLKGSLMSRFDKPAEGRMVVVMQRLHQDDLIGRLMADGGWTLLELPGEAWRQLEIEVSDYERWNLSPGGLLFPEVFGPSALKQQRIDLGQQGYDAQILQRPTPPGGAMFQLKWFNRYDAVPQAGFERIYQSWDTAMVESDTADYSVCTTWGVRGRHLYLLDVDRRRLVYHKLEQALPSLRDKHSADYVVVEDAGTGTILFQQLRGVNGHRWLLRMKPRLSKRERAAAQSAKIERGRIYLPNSAPWLETFESEVAAFPFGKYDDQVDSMVQFLGALELARGNAAFAELSMFAGGGEPL